MTIADTDIFLADVGARDPNTGETTLHFSGGQDNTPLDYQTGVSDTPASTPYLSRLAQVAMLPRTMFGDRTTSGRSQVSVGDVVLRNEDFALDVYKRYAFDGRRIVVRRGQGGAAYPAAFTPVLDATMTAPTWDGPVALKVRDNQKYLDVPLQTTKYAGDNVAPDGLEGTPDDLKGKLKPVCICGATNISPPCVNAPKLIWQVHDGVIGGIPAVRDRGAVLRSGIGAWADQASGFGGDDINGLTYGAGLFVAVGNAGKLFTSPNGETWTSRTSQFGATNIRAVGYDATLGLFVAVGGSGKISTSTNGTSWTSRTSGTASNLNAVGFFTGSLIIAGGDSGTIVTSPDGTTWTTRTSNAVGGIRGIAANSTRIIAVGGIGSTSDDGTTWVAMSTPLSDTTQQAATVTQDELFIVANANARLWRSLDVSGTLWQTLAGPGGTPGVYNALAVGGGYMLAVSNAGSTTNAFWSIDDGATWQAGPPAHTNIALYAAAYGNGVFVVAGSGGILAISTSADDYADTTELLNDDIAPAPGTYKVYLGGAGGGAFFRLGSSPFGQVTCDVLQGATAADRTAAQAFVQANQRAGNTTGDWSASDIIALDAADDGEVEFWAGPDDTDAMCSDVADAAARTVGAGWWADTNGVIRIRQLTEPGTNLVTNPDTITAGGGWTLEAGVAGTPAFSVVNGVSLTRLTGLAGGSAYRPVTIPTDGAKRFLATVEFESAGVSSHGLFNITAGIWVARVDVTWASDGTATAAAVNGSALVFVRVRPGAYSLAVTSTATTAVHTHRVYGAAGGAIAAVRVGGVTIYDPVAALIVDENDLVSNLTPLPSNDPNGGLSPNTTTLRYAHNHTPQTTDLADIVTDADRVFYGLDWREAVDGSMASVVLARHPLSQPASIETLYRFEADAQAEATRRQTLFGVDREWYECGVKMTTATVALDLGDVIELAHERFLFGAGTRLRILGIKPEIQENARESRIMLTLWR